MKRILTLLVAVTMVLGAWSQAYAVEFGASGRVHTVFGAQNNLFGGFDKDAGEDNFYARSRIRATVEAKASENIKGVWEMEVGTWRWGENARLSSNIKDTFMTRQAYVSWNVPKTTATVNMGIQNLALPSATFGNPIFNDRAAGVTVGGVLADGIAITGFWARPYNNPKTDNYTPNFNYNSVDMFGAIVDLDFGAAKLSPYVVYGRVGHDNGLQKDATTLFSLGDDAPMWAVGAAGAHDAERSNLYVAGAAVELTAMEALSLKLDAMYGSAKNDSKDGYETDGFMVSAALDYAMPFGTPGVFGWYSSGADKNGEGVLPVLGVDGGFAPTVIGFMGSASCGVDTVISAVGVGTMGAGLALSDLSFMDKLTHDFRAAYVRGTNDKKFETSPLENTYSGINEKDSFFEFDLVSQYDIMENWVAVLELAYIMPTFDQKNAAGNKVTKDDSGYIGQLYFLYNF